MDLGPGYSPWDLRYSHGWGKQGTRNEGVHFKQAIINSAKFIEQSVIRIAPTDPADCSNFVYPISLATLRQVLVHRCCSQPVDTEPLDPSFIEKYFSELQKAQNTKKEFSEHEYKEIMKIVVNILKTLGVPQFGKKQAIASSASALK
jgi:hypothetical protein